MSKPPKSDRAIAEAAGYYIREGAFRSAPDNQLGRWYVGHSAEEFFRPFGAGHASQKAAWAAAAELAQRKD